MSNLAAGSVAGNDEAECVLVPAFDLDNENSDASRRSWSPKFFPAVDGYIDGGVFANNPSMAALAQTQDHRATKKPPRHDRIALLSIGTGTSLMRIERKNLDWSQAQWIKPLLNIMMDGVMGVADYQCRQILGDRYHRLAPVFPPDQVIGLDAVDRIPYLVKFAETVGECSEQGKRATSARPPRNASMTTRPGIRERAAIAASVGPYTSPRSRKTKTDQYNDRPIQRP